MKKVFKPRDLVKQCGLYTEYKHGRIVYIPSVPIVSVVLLLNLLTPRLNSPAKLCIFMKTLLFYVLSSKIVNL